MPVPLSATSSAAHATTMAGEGRRQSFLMSIYPFRFDLPASQATPGVGRFPDEAK